MSSDICGVKNLDNSSNIRDPDTYLKDTKGGLYTQGIDYRRVDDIYQMNFSPCYLDSLEKFQCKAYINIPLFQGEKLWGLFCVYQKSGAREWKESEIRTLLQFSAPLATVLNQADIINQLTEESAKVAQAVARERTLTRINDRIRESLDLDIVFRTAVDEIRKFLKAGRSVVYRFHPDWSGEIVAESVTAGWAALMEIQEKNSSLKQDSIKSDRCMVKQYGSPAQLDPDTYFQENQGGAYNQGQKYRQVDDIYAMGFSGCYIATLEKLECRAYINVPIFQ